MRTGQSIYSYLKEAAETSPPNRLKECPCQSAEPSRVEPWLITTVLCATEVT